MSNHTPGPWSLVGKTIVDAQGDSLIEVLSAYSADLRLIAAAPEMLELIKEMTYCLMNCWASLDPIETKYSAQFLERINALVAKASHE